MTKFEPLGTEVFLSVAFANSVEKQLEKGRDRFRGPTVPEFLEWRSQIEAGVKKLGGNVMAGHRFEEVSGHNAVVLNMTLPAHLIHEIVSISSEATAAARPKERNIGAFMNLLNYQVA